MTADLTHVDCPEHDESVGLGALDILDVGKQDLRAQVQQRARSGKGLDAVKKEDFLSIDVTHLDGVAVLALRGEIDGATAPGLRESVERVCDLGVPVVLDMCQVTFMDSSGISALIAASGISTGVPRSVRIHHPSDHVRRLLSLTGLDTLLLLDP